ncbi:protein of unknown function [Trichlorobacter ammonificans]|uniref:Uncharacterized protein n=1 Tax=Trichlorobacter ammonificans TaxID=2916410 RepID=A0ABM9DA57_9BACT|nr:protein of unknown function [Trichlorobacter ammonificans]
MDELLRNILSELRAIRSALDAQAAPVRTEYYRQLASSPLTPESVQRHNSAVLKRQRQKVSRA